MIIGNRIIDIGLEKVKTFVQCLQKQQSHAVVLKVKENHGVLRILRWNGGSQTKPINTLGWKITSDFHGLLCPSSSTGLFNWAMGLSSNDSRCFSASSSPSECSTMWPAGTDSTKSVNRLNSYIIIIGDLLIRSLNALLIVKL